jgi:hypothetical protein
MGRKKCDPESLLVHRVRVRITDGTMKKLESLRSKSNCRSMAEFLRKVLANEKIVMLHRDMRLQGHIQELAGIRTELKAIGTNVNQITRHFHAANNDRRKMFYAMEVAEEYAKVGEKVTALMEMVDTLGQKWLQR